MLMWDRKAVLTSCGECRLSTATFRLSLNCSSLWVSYRATATSHSKNFCLNCATERFVQLGAMSPANIVACRPGSFGSYSRFNLRQA